jgi:S1-C subfamily serine protease
MSPKPLVATAILLGGLAALPPGARADAKLYRKVAPSAVLFLLKTGHASGVLIDADKKLVATAAHVVDSELRGGSAAVKVIFPSKDKAGRLITSAVFYKKQPEHVTPGEVVYLNRAKDLALVRIDRVPPGVVGVPLATEDPDPGEDVHVIGNSNLYHGGTFGYSEGKVRNVHFYDVGGRVFTSVTHHAPTNQGDSGGPVLDNAGKLLGVVSQGTTGQQRQQVVDHSVHFSEIKRALEFVQQPGGGQVVVRAAAGSRGSDEFYVPVTKGANVAVDLKGEKKTDLDLFAYDVDGPDNGKAGKTDDPRRVIAGTGLSDQEKGAFQAGWSGYARVEVSNLGKDNAFANTYTLSITPVRLDAGNKAPLAAPITAIRRIAAKGEDSYEFTYQANAGKARVGLRGDGDTVLNLTVEDPTGAVVGSAKCQEELADVVWNPAATGSYKVRVKNNGGVYNKYVLTTD